MTITITATGGMRKTAIGLTLNDLYDSPRFDSGKRSRSAGHPCAKDDKRHGRWRRSRKMIQDLKFGK